MLAGLAFTLSGIGAAAAGQYSDRRLALVAAGLAAIGAVGLLGVLNQVSPRYGAPFSISLTPLLLLLVAVACIYAASVARTSQAPAR